MNGTHAQALWPMPAARLMARTRVSCSNPRALGAAAEGSAGGS